MSLRRNSWLVAAATAIALFNTGCGRHVAPLAPMRPVAQAVAQGIPPIDAFKVVTGTVVKILPADTDELPHQNFVIQVNGQLITINNDTKYGTEIPNLSVGQQLTIRGVQYTDPGKIGMHWTHHANKAGDAGYIQTADGHVYQ